MAKWTKRNNPHVWSKKTMAKPKQAQIIRYSAPRVAQPIIRVSAPRAAPKKKHHRRKGGDGGGLNQQRLISLALGGAVFGFIEKSFGAQLPTLPVIGRAGTITLAACYRATRSVRRARLPAKRSGASCPKSAASPRKSEESRRRALLNVDHFSSAVPEGRIEHVTFRSCWLRT